MNCEQFKNLIRETPDLDTLDHSQELALHLKSCQSCRSFFEYERTLRKSFSSIANEAPPAQLAARIFAIPSQSRPESAGEKEPGLFESLKIFFSGFPLKTAFASGIVGFLLAVALLPQQQHHVQNRQKPIELGQAQPEDRLEFESKSRTTPQNLPEPDQTKGKAENLVIAKSMPSSAKKPAAKDQKRDFAGAQASDEYIPGAISFSLAEDKAVRLEPEAGSQPQTPTASLAANRKRAEVFPARESLMESSFSIKEEEAADRKISKEDQRCSELESLIASYELQIPTGFLNIRNLAAQGVIEGERLDYFSPPPGMNWYLEKKDGRLKITLKKEE